MVNLNYITLPDSFYEEEIRLGYRITRQMKEVWAIQLDMLQLVKQICQKHSIQWFAHGGAALGAARDGHFIPWDDDIDIMMTRDNYNRFIQAWKQEKTPEEYFMQNSFTDNECRHKLTKIKRVDTLMAPLANTVHNGNIFGIFLDIFPLDKIPNGETERLDFVDKLMMFRRDPKLIDDYYSYVTKYNDDDECVAYMDSSMITKAKYDCMIYKVANFTSTVEIDFEGIKIPLMSGYENFLSDKYGESWETPENVPSNHNPQMFDTDNSYKAYIWDDIQEPEFSGTEEFRMVKKINSYVRTGKHYVCTEENDFIKPNIRTYDEVVRWMFSLPENLRRFIEIQYTGGNRFKYVVKNNAGESLQWKEGITDLSVARSTAVFVALRSIVVQIEDEL